MIFVGRAVSWQLLMQKIQKGQVRWVKKSDVWTQNWFISRVFGLAARTQPRLPFALAQVPSSMFATHPDFRFKSRNNCSGQEATYLLSEIEAREMSQSILRKGYSL